MLTWSQYWRIFVRRWPIVAAILLLTILAGGYQFLKARRHVGYQACLTLYVSDVSSPSLTVGASGATDVLLAGETAANFFADDILDVSQSQRVARYLSGTLRKAGLPSTSEGDINGAIGGSRRDRTVNLCVTNPNQASALAVAKNLGVAMERRRSQFIGPKLARRTYVHVVSDASVGPAPSSKALTNFLLRIVLGALVALGAALLWDALDPNVRDEEDVSHALGAPVIVTVARSSRS
ncbi:MAG: hypothetical protein ACR2JC_10620 [Chloroflexota bacterium]|nr:MAG: hypothetical protein DLM70_13820 [Chloroflexota bacterium]